MSNNLHICQLYLEYSVLQLITLGIQKLGRMNQSIVLCQVLVSTFLTSGNIQMLTLLV